MSKKIFGLLMVLCLIVGLLPVVASADANPADATVKIGTTTLTLTGFDAPLYTKNYEKETQDTAGNKFTKWGQTKEGATEENYNAKFEWKTGDAAPTLTLRGFKLDEWNNETGLMEGKWNEEKQTYSGLQTYAITTGSKTPMNIVITGEDSLIEAKFGITYYADTTIKSEGNAKLTMFNVSSCIAPNKTTGNLTIDANLNLSVGGLYNTQFTSAVIHTYGGDLTINGGNIVCKIRQEEAKGVVAIAARNGGNLTINGGTIDAMSIVGAGATNGCITSTAGKLTINGGNLKVKPKRAVGLYGKTGIEINGGTTDILTPYYGLNAGTKEEPADITINGGTVKIMAQYSFYKAPVIGSKVFAFAGPNEEDAEVYDGTNAQLCKKPWWLSTDDENQKIETKPDEEEDDLPIFTLPSDPATTPSTPAGSTPATTPSTPAGSTPVASTPATTPVGGGQAQTPSGNNGSQTGNETTAPTEANEKTEDEGGSSAVLWIVVAVILVGAGAAVAFILIKRKKAA